MVPSRSPTPSTRAAGGEGESGNWQHVAGRQSPQSMKGPVVWRECRYGYSSVPVELTVPDPEAEGGVARNPLCIS